MYITIQRLSPSLLDDFLYYFDHVGFTDHPEWAGCYCLESHMTLDMEAEIEADGVRGRREKAKELVNAGIMNGYLAYDGNKAIGWCNADDKRNYCRICENREYGENKSKEKVKVIYCFDIAPEYRGRGIASKLLDRVLTDAAADGYDVAEGYPDKGQTGIYQYHGPKKLYETYGFTLYKEIPACYIMRKTLKIGEM